MAMLQEIKQQNTDLKTQITNLQKTTDSLSAALKLTNQNITSMDKKIDSIRNQLSSMVIQINSLSNQLNQANVNIADIQKRIAELQAKCQELVDLLRILTNTINLSNGLIAYYPFNGNANDESGNGNNLTVMGPTLTSDRFGLSNKAYLFQGVQNEAQYLVTNKIDVFKVPIYSFSIWFKLNSYYPNTTQANAFDYANFNLLGILALNSNVWSVGPAISSLIISNAKQLYHGHWTPTNGGQGQVYNDTISLDKWYNLIINYDGNKTRMYLNGLIINETSSPLSYNNQFDLTIGGQRNGTNMSVMAGFKGIIDDLRWYNRILTQEEINYLATH